MVELLASVGVGSEHSPCPHTETGGPSSWLTSPPRSCHRWTDPGRTTGSSPRITGTVRTDHFSRWIPSFLVRDQMLAPVVIWTWSCGAAFYFDQQSSIKYCHQTNEQIWSIVPRPGANQMTFYIRSSLREYYVWHFNIDIRHRWIECHHSGKKWKYMLSNIINTQYEHIHIY